MSKSRDDQHDTTPVGQRIRQARKARGWSLRELSEMTGISWGFIGRIERGDDDCTARKVKRLCDALGISGIVTE